VLKQQNEKVAGFLITLFLLQAPKISGKIPEFFWKNSGKFPTFYFSGKVTTLTITIIVQHC